VRNILLHTCVYLLVLISYLEVCSSDVGLLKFHFSNIPVLQLPAYSSKRLYCSLAGIQ